MIISKAYATRLIKQGKATAEGTVVSDGWRCMALTRHDIQRTDHYRIERV